MLDFGSLDALIFERRRRLDLFGRHLDGLLVLLLALLRRELNDGTGRLGLLLLGVAEVGLLSELP